MSAILNSNLADDTSSRTNASLAARRKASVPRGIVTACGIVVERADNAEVWDVSGRRYLDFAGGVGCLNTGHRHPRVVAAVEAQLQRFTHMAFQVAAYEGYIELAERLNALAPGAWPKKTLLLSTGAEAVENAVKVARAYTGRPGVISFSGAFHGRTMLTLAMTGRNSPYKLGFGPLPGDIYHAPFPIPYHGVTVEQALSALDVIFRASIEPERIAAMIIEPVQGEGGFYVAPKEFLQKLRAICDLHGIVLIADEIQCGFARTGRMCAIEHSGVIPDLVVLAKSLAAGLPLAALVGRAEIMDAPAPGGLGGTYGGNPLGCAAALAVLDIIEEESLLERSIEFGSLIRNRLRELSLRDDVPCIGDVRGLGGMVGFEIVEKRDTRAPDRAMTQAIQSCALENGLIILTCGIFGNVIRILVPLTASVEQLEEGMDILAASLKQAARRT
jgi:4-aminobutyrate aminotransferase / (S)-3-amino-2-methylpropionate transaminase / 5-aminovalerate transaminase